MFALALPATPSCTAPASVEIGERPRRSCTSCSVDTLDGPSVGTTWNATTVLSLDVPIGTTADTWCCAAIRSPMVTSCCSSASPVVLAGRSATTSRAPF